MDWVLFLVVKWCMKLVLKCVMMWFGCGDIMIILVFRKSVFLMECVMKKICLFVCVQIDISSFCICLWVMLLSVLKGLFMSRILGFGVKVWVRFICWCMLFESLQGVVLVKFCSFMRCNNFCVWLWFLLWGMLVNFRFRVMLFSIDFQGSRLFFWNMMLCLVLGLEIGLLLRVMLFLESGRNFVMVLSKVDLLQFEVFSVIMKLCLGIFSEIWFSVWIICLFWLVQKMLVFFIFNMVCFF